MAAPDACSRHLGASCRRAVALACRSSRSVRMIFPDQIPTRSFSRVMLVTATGGNRSAQAHTQQADAAYGGPLTVVFQVAREHLDEEDVQRRGS